MTGIEAYIGMNDVNSTWNGLSMAYEVSFDDGYGYKKEENGEYAVKVQVPGLCGDRRSDAQVVQDTGEASFELPPCAPGTGLRMPRVPNPYSSHMRRPNAQGQNQEYHFDDPNEQVVIHPSTDNGDAGKYGYNLGTAREAPPSSYARPGSYAARVIPRQT